MKFLKYSSLLVIVILFSSTHANTQEKKASKSNNKTLIQAAKEIMQNAKTCALITVDDKGIARVRTMDPFPPKENLIVWFGTNSNSRKVKQIQENNNVTLYYEDPDKTGYVTIYGIATIVNDVTEKEKHWKTKWKDFYPNYPKDYTLIKVIPKWMEVVSETRGILGDTKTWKPQKVTF
ncbi:pyridoxamine 5'-phosphate oxidase family protein [Pontimicrobium aquaticum]|uniref:General stress protein FMN-binding split barrel domain-containing protein n=1 Tax=Pontimicrobium aquaticum TaxID=2565367 RepID=A0A4U0EK39_9FLAO|nr:pyridoxamine 5'-phosphate oxidase family protein [Pontimicrobium aquaticum]TJY31847.1 hypothetical protein E5167_14930 [Pontimicrobium aquaticum]